MIRRYLLRGALLASALLASSGAFAQSLVGGTVLNGGVPSYNVNATAPFTIDQGTLALRVFVVNGTGGGGGGGSSGPSYVGQYNSTLPTFASGQAGYLSVDSNGRLILSPVGVAQDATLTARLGTLGQKTMAGSTPVAIASDQSAIPVTGTFWQSTQPISASALPLPAGAATAANQATVISNQNVTSAGTSATNAQAVQGVTNGVPLPTTSSANTTIAVARTTVGTATTLISAADPTNRRTVLNNGTVACEIGPSGFAYGAGFPIAAGQSFTFDNAGRNTAAIYGACSASGGTFAVVNY